MTIGGWMGYLAGTDAVFIGKKIGLWESRDEVIIKERFISKEWHGL